MLLALQIKSTRDLLISTKANTQRISSTDNARQFRVYRAEREFFNKLLVFGLDICQRLLKSTIAYHRDLSVSLKGIL